MHVYTVTVASPGKCPWAHKHSSRFRPVWALTLDVHVIPIHLYSSCYLYPLKFGTWALTRERALVQDTRVLLLYYCTLYLTCACTFFFQSEEGSSHPLWLARIIQSLNKCLEQLRKENDVLIAKTAMVILNTIIRYMCNNCIPLAEFSPRNTWVVVAL